MIILFRTIWLFIDIEYLISARDLNKLYLNACCSQLWIEG